MGHLVRLTSRWSWLSAKIVREAMESKAAGQRKLPVGEVIQNAKEPLAFISYRKQDSSAASRWLHQTIQRTSGPISVLWIRNQFEWPMIGRSGSRAHSGQRQ